MTRWGILRHIFVVPRHFYPFRRLGWSLAGNPLDYRSNKEIVCNHFVGVLLYMQCKIRFYEWPPCLLTLQVLYW